MSKETPSFPEKRIRTWGGLLAQGKKLTQEKEPESEEWLFRGMQRSSWKLEPSLERTCKTHYGEQGLIEAPRIENILTREFRRRYHNHGVGISDPVGIEWLSLMQHYGAPTRLLDVTYSFFIAAYFAMEKPCEKSSSHAIWAIRTSWIKEGIQLLGEGLNDTDYLKNEQNERQWESQQSFFESLLHLRAHSTEEHTRLSRNNPPCAFPVNGMRLNERATVQQGAFLCPGNVTQPFEDNLKQLQGFDSPENLVKIIIPGKLRVEALARLHAMNINRAALFPGLEGFAASLGIYHPLAFSSGQNS